MKKKIVFVNGKLGGLFTVKCCKNCIWWKSSNGVKGECGCYGGPLDECPTSASDKCFEFDDKR